MCTRACTLGKKVVHKDFAVVQDCHPSVDGFVQSQLAIVHANLGQIFREEHVAQVPVAGNQFPYFSASLLRTILMSTQFAGFP